MLITWFVLLLVAIPAFAQTPTPSPPTWLVMPTVAAAQARSAAECKARGCDGVRTIYWWHVERNSTTGEGALRLESALRKDNSDFTAGKMTAAERSAMIPDAALRGRPGWLGH
jgi:hypothetical protein